MRGHIQAFASVIVVRLIRGGWDMDPYLGIAGIIPEGEDGCCLPPVVFGQEYKIDTSQPCFPIIGPRRNGKGGRPAGDDESGSLVKGDIWLMRCLNRSTLPVQATAHSMIPPHAEHFPCELAWGIS